MRARLEVQQLQRAEPCGPSELETLESSHGREAGSALVLGFFQSDGRARACCARSAWLSLSEPQDESGGLRGREQGRGAM